MTPAEKLAEEKGRKPPTPKRYSVTPLVCNLRTIRTALGLTRTNVAEALKMQSSSYGYLERGNNLFISTAKRIAIFFGKTVEEIFA